MTTLDEYVGRAKAALATGDRGSIREVALSLGDYQTEQAKLLRAYLAGYLAAPEAPASAAKMKRAMLRDDAPDYWFKGCYTGTATATRNPAKVRARAAEWAAASPAFRAYVLAEGNGWWAKPLASWPDCPERAKVEATRTRYETRFQAAVAEPKAWRSMAQWQVATAHAPVVRFEKDGQQNPEDAAKWAAYMEKARALTSKFAPEDEHGYLAALMKERGGRGA